MSCKLLLIITCVTHFSNAEAANSKSPKKHRKGPTISLPKADSTTLESTFATTSSDQDEVLDIKNLYQAYKFKYFEGTYKKKPCKKHSCPKGLYCIPTYDKLKYKCSICKKSGKDPNNNCKSCEPGYFDADCDKKCKCKKGSKECHPTKGCKKGCKKGWLNQPLCDKVDCKFNPCQNSATCKRKCNCLPQWTGPECEVYLGTAHLVKCQRNICAHKGKCYLKPDGTRLCECVMIDHGNTKIQFSGIRCQNTCEKGTASCAHGSCEYSGKGDGVGICINCTSGWNGLWCHKPCPNGWYGHQCAQKCGQCISNACDKVDGICGAAGCLRGYKGKRCTKKAFFKSPYKVKATPRPPLKKMRVKGELKLKGKYDSNLSAAKSTTRDSLKKSTKTFIKKGILKTGRTEKVKVKQVTFDEASLTPEEEVKQLKRRKLRQIQPVAGGVLVEYVVEFDTNTENTRDIQSAVTTSLRENMDLFETKLNYAVISSSIRTVSVAVLSVDLSAEDVDQGLFAAHFVTIFGLVGLVIGLCIVGLCYCYIKSCKRSRKKPPPHTFLTSQNEPHVVLNKYR